jgi:hypothetical protein
MITRADLLAVIGHDLRQPLSAALVAVEFTSELLEGGSRIDVARSQIALAERCVRQALGMADDLLATGQVDAGTLRLGRSAVDFMSLLDETCALIAPFALAKRVALEVIAGPSLPRAMADHDRLLQVIGNLCSNAVKFTPADGRVALCAVERGESVDVSWYFRQRSSARVRRVLAVHRCGSRRRTWLGNRQVDCRGAWRIHRGAHGAGRWANCRLHDSVAADPERHNGEPHTVALRMRRRRRDPPYTVTHIVRHEQPAACAVPSSSTNPVRMSTGIPFGTPAMNGTKMTLYPLFGLRFQDPCCPTNIPRENAVASSAPPRPREYVSPSEDVCGPSA